jgi:hypothetical protein
MQPPIEERATATIERVATTVERVGAPAATLAIGATIIILNSGHEKLGPLVWVGAVLVLAALGVYVWLTQRSTTHVQSLPPVVPDELMQDLRWLRDEMSEQNKWLRAQLEKTGPPST